MRKTLKYALATAAALLATANAECSATVTSTARQGDGQFEINGVPHQIYDISVTNTGDETIKSLFSFFGYPAGNSLYQTWNYDGSSGEINLYGDLAVSAIFNGAGFILAGPDTPTVAFTRPTCESAPAESSSAESSSEVPAESSSAESSSEVPTESSSEVPAESSESAESSSAAPSPCDIEASLRLGSSWTTDGVNYASYHVFIKNNGECPMTDYVTSFALNGGEIYESWNLESTLGGYAVKGFGEVLHAGDTYGGAGFNIRNAGDIQITPYGSNCKCE